MADDWHRKFASQWTYEDVADRAADWDDACENFDSYPVVGIMSDGAPIRMMGDWGEGVREKSGFICSPIAYSVRNLT